VTAFLDGNIISAFDFQLHQLGYLATIQEFEIRISPQRRYLKTLQAQMWGYLPGSSLFLAFAVGERDQ
jgi:hypothetical protein